MAKILIAEDEQDIRDLVAFTLRYAGHEVVAVGDGAEAVEKARVMHPDLVLLDVRMPRMNGYDACRSIKSDPQTQDIPVVFLSAKGQESEIETGFSAGALDYLLKPFAPDDLNRRVNELLEQSMGGRNQ
ncbi:MAG: response regulator [Chloroflexi bacterium]|jgi:CheY-like chemotaxis protein|nr:response regulator [Anaerolineaceae bacterium]NMB88115.1 response regulator [Chloroflexota bacterium]